MKVNLISRFLLLIILTTTLFASGTLPVSANYQHKTTLRSTVISLVPLKDLNLGDKFEIMGSIQDSSGYPIENEHIFIYVNDDYLGQAKSDMIGLFVLKVNKKLDAGNYIIHATFQGSRFFSGSDYSTPLKINTSTLTIQTVPALPGVVFRMNGKKVFSDENGNAKFQFTKSGIYRCELRFQYI